MFIHVSSRVYTCGLRHSPKLRHTHVIQLDLSTPRSKLEKSLHRPSFSSLKASVRACTGLETAWEPPQIHRNRTRRLSIGVPLPTSTRHFRVRHFEDAQALWNVHGHDLTSILWTRNGAETAATASKQAYTPSLNKNQLLRHFSYISMYSSYPFKPSLLGASLLGLPAIKALRKSTRMGTTG